MRKKIIYLVMAMMCLANVSKAESIEIDDFTMGDGDTLQVALRLTNTHTDLTAFSMTMQLPSGLKLEEVSSTDRYKGEIQVGNPDTKAYNICGLDLAFGTISGTEGDLLLLTFTADKTFKTSEITISDIDFITTGRQHVTVDNVTFTVTSRNKSDVLLGDVNGSGDVDITDALTIVDYVLGKLSPTSTFIRANADVDKDGDINLTDALYIIDVYVLHKN